MQHESASLTREQLEAMVPIDDHGEVRLADIPQPWRDEFFNDSIGSTLSPRRGNHYVGDWHKWLRIRFTDGYKPLRWTDGYEPLRWTE